MPACGRRGALTDRTLDFFDRCFAADVVEANGQPFLFLPRPPRPPLFIGGAPMRSRPRPPRARREPVAGVFAFDGRALAVV